MPTCQSCTQTYDLLPGEEALHHKINDSFEVGSFPIPSLCADCRLQKKMVWRNERHLYQRTCDSTGKNILSVYPADAPFPVYEREAWWSDAWDALDYGQDPDFQKPFFVQCDELRKKVPRQALNIQKSENCDYCNFAFESRNCYLSQCCYRTESLFYCYWLLDSKDCIDCSYCFESQRLLNCIDCNHSYNCRSCILSHTCTDCSFLYDCRGCHDCLGCVGLRRKSFCLFNEQLTKEEYAKRLKEFDMGDPAHVKAFEDRMHALKMKHPHLYSVQEKTENCSGDYIFESKDCNHCYQIYRARDCMHAQDADGITDVLHTYHPGWSELTYEMYSPVTQRASAFSFQCWTGNDIFYCDNCQSCSHCFGCVSLKHKKYCILNKQYEKDEYLKIVSNIRAHMESTGEWGMFFPIESSPFAYNETMAQQDFPLSEEDVTSRGWHWSHDTLMTTGKETIVLKELPTNIRDIPDSVTKEIFACEKCSRNYKIVPQELNFYRDMGAPLPAQCPDCRYHARLQYRNPRKLWKRACAQCKKSIETSYAPDRPEIVYCEECYLQTVY